MLCVNRTAYNFFGHIFYEFMTAINLITIIFFLPADFGLDEVCGRVLIRLGAVVTRALSGTVARRLTLMEAGGKWPLEPASTLRSPLREPPSFVLGSEITLREAIGSHIIPPSHT